MSILRRRTYDSNKKIPEKYKYFALNFYIEGEDSGESQYIYNSIDNTTICGEFPGTLRLYGGQSNGTSFGIFAQEEKSNGDVYLYCVTQYYIYKSTDGGQNWNNLIKWSNEKIYSQNFKPIIYVKNDVVYILISAYEDATSGIKQLQLYKYENGILKLIKTLSETAEVEFEHDYKKDIIATYHYKFYNKQGWSQYQVSPNGNIVFWMEDKQQGVAKYRIFNVMSGNVVNDYKLGTNYNYSLAGLGQYLGTYINYTQGLEYFIIAWISSGDALEGKVTIGILKTDGNFTTLSVADLFSLNSSLQSARYSIDGNMIVNAYRDNVLLYKYQDLNLNVEFSTKINIGPYETFKSVYISPDSKYIVLISNLFLYIINNQGKILKKSQIQFNYTNYGILGPVSTIQ